MAAVDLTHATGLFQRFKVRIDLGRFWSVHTRVSMSIPII